MFNFLVEPLIRARHASGEIKALSLPGVYAALMRDEIDSFPALRPHQRHVWHAFLVQAGGLALLGAGTTEMPDDEAGGLKPLRGLTPQWADDSPRAASSG